MTGARAIKAALFALVWFSCAWFGSWELNPNNAVRLFAAISLVEDGDATIDEFAPLTIDKAEFDGHVYSDKAPGMTLMALPAVALATAVTGERSAGVRKDFYDQGLARFVCLRLRVAVATGPALLTALAAVLLFDLGLSLTGRVGAGLFASLGYALGTPIWGWSTTMLGHAPVAALFVVTLWAVWRSATASRPRPLAFFTGASLGWAVAVEYQAVLAGSVIALWAVARWWRQPRRWALIGAAAAGGVLLLLPVLAYNQLAFGTPFRVGYSGVVGWEGMQQGLFGLVWPKASVFLAILVKPAHGMIWVAPILAAAILGMIELFERREQRGLATAATLVVVTVLLVNAAYVYWEGGNATGPRLSVPLIGALSIGLAPFWAGLASRVERVAVAALLALSIGLNAGIASAEIFAPPLYRYPIWQAVLAGPFARGDLRTVASEWWGWTPWQGFALWAVVALPTMMWLVGVASRSAPVEERRR